MFHVMLVVSQHSRRVDPNSFDTVDGSEIRRSHQLRLVDLSSS